MITLTEKIVARDARYEADYAIFPVYLIENALSKVVSLSYEPCSDKLFEKISKTIEYYHDLLKQSYNQKWAYYQILLQDLSLWLKTCRNKKLHSNIDEILLELNERVPHDIREYLEINYIDPYPVYIEDKLPGPFRDSHWDALNVRPGFHPYIPIGIYFSKTTLTDYSKVTLYHEHLHIATTPKENDFHFIPWFDEGLCDVVSHIFSIKYFDDWENHLKMMIRKYTTDDLEYRIRGWSAKTVAQMILNYGIDFFKYVVKKRAECPQEVKWDNLYYCIKNMGDLKQLSRCFKSEIPKRFFNFSLPPAEEMVCKKLISYELPVTLSPLAYWILKEFLERSRLNKGNFAFMSYKEILKEIPNVNIDIAKQASCELNGLLAISTERDGLRSWDTKGYYKDILKYHFIKTRGIESNCED